jgi:hypothetical protein
MSPHRATIRALSLLGAIFCLPLQSLGQGNAAQSNVFTLDTRPGTLIRGVILDGTAPYGPYAPLPGANATIAATSATSDSRGRFEVKVPLPTQQTFTITASGFAAWTRPVGPSQNGNVIDLGAITLRPADKPVVLSAKFDPEYCFLADRGLQTQLTVTINWLTFTPLRVELREGTRLLASDPTSGGTTTFPLDIDARFPGGSPRAYNLVITAIGTGPGGEVTSLPLEQPIHVFPWPTFLQPLKSQAVTNAQSIALDFSLSTKEHKVTLPVIGRFGYEFALGGSFDYGLTDGSWEAAVGLSASGSQGKRGRRPKIPGFTNYDRPRFYIGNRELELAIFARAAGNGLPGYGIQVEEVAGGMSLSARLELARYGLLDLVGPGLTTGVRKIAGEDFVRNFSVRLDALPEISGEGVFAPRWPLNFKEATLDLGLGLEAVYQPKVAGKSAKVYLGGKATGTFGLPEPIFRSVNFKGYAGIKVDAWVFDYNAEYVFLDYTFPGRRLPAGSYPIEGGMLLAAMDNGNDWGLRERSWRNAGTEQFLPVAAGPARRLDAEQSETLAALDRFNKMSATPSPGAVYLPPAIGPGRRLISDPTLPAGAELPLLSNVYPGSSPSLASRGNDLMLLYVRDTGATNPAQFTEIAWTRYNGTSWTTPQALASNPAAQFRPQVTYAANGDAIAVFERVKDPAYSGSDITAYAGLMEICWSRWDQTTQTWSAPVALTDNAILDFDPRLAGPMADGSLVACWRESTAGELEASTTAPQRLMSARWSPGTGTWTAPVALLAADEGLLACDISAAADKAVVTWCVDGDGDSATANDSEIFYRVFTAGAWGAATALTADALPDRNPQVWVDATGNASLVWDKNGALVLSRNFAAPAAIRDTAESLTVAEYSITGGPGGNLVLLWQDMGDDGSDAFYRVYDPASNQWSQDTRMSADSDVEQDFSPVWDAMGNLTIAYNNSAVTLQTVSVATQGAGTVEVENVPQTGQVDLLLAKRAIVRDLAIVTGSLKTTGLGFAPGQVANVTCEVANTGNVAVNAPVVAFFNGDPAAGGVEIHRQTLAGWLTGSETREVTYAWTIPAPAQTRVLHAVIDPDQTVTEFSETNNEASISVGGSDLEVAALSTTVLRDGAMRCVAKVTNIGSAPAAVAGLKLFREGTPPLMLQETTVPQIEAGSSTEWVFDLPPGTQPEGEGYYLLTVDGEALSGDPDPLNNTASFTAVLWIDDDNDGLPRWWEQANGLSDSDPLDGIGDRDGDGFSDAAEYLAGTDPRNANDYLRVGQFHTTAAAPDGANRQVSFSWASAPGALYDVQRSSTLSGTWETIAQDVPATAPLNTYTDALPAHTPKAFYRLLAK